MSIFGDGWTAALEAKRALVQPLGFEGHHVCGACGWVGYDVEAGGLWYCPNPRCQGCAGGARHHVESCMQCLALPLAPRERVSNVIELKQPCAAFLRDHAPSNVGRPR